MKCRNAFKRTSLVLSAFGPFTKNKVRTLKKKKKNRETADSRYIYRNEIKKLVFKMILLMEILKI